MLILVLTSHAIQMLLSTCQAIGEMAVSPSGVLLISNADFPQIMYPVSGGFYTLVGRFIDPSWAFAMGSVAFI